MSDHLLGDLVEYRNYKDKTVTAAARSLIQLFREKNPQMLHRKIRGKPTEETFSEVAKMRQYGELDAKSFIPGAEIITDGLLETKQQTAPSKTLNVEEDSDIDENEEEWVEESEEEEETEEEEEEEEKGKASGENKSRKRKHSEVDEDSDEEEWVKVSDEEEQLKDETSTKLTLEEKEKLASKISSERIFTQEDFKRIRVEQLKKKLSDKNFVKNKDKKTISVDTDSEEEKAMKKYFINLNKYKRDLDELNIKD